MAKKKTTRQESHQRELFAQFFVAGKSKTDAHELAGFSAKTRKGRAKEASRMSRIPAVAARIQELKDELAAEFHYTRKEAFDELVEVQDIARGGLSEGVPVPANPAVMAKVVGQKIDLAGIEPPKKQDLNVTGGIRLTLPGEVSRKEWEDGE